MDSHLSKNTDWFENWFDTRYYHILYKNRNDEEAQQFISNLIHYLKPNPASIFLDVACGKGRHAIFLNSLGFQVDAFDLSANSIESAKLSEKEGLKFFINDIRKPLKTTHYDYAFNLFTSFGYFEDESDNEKAISAISDSLKPGGLLVLDFMNAHKVVQQLVPMEQKKVDDIQFHISREVKDQFIIKHICFKADEQDHYYKEMVKALSYDDFKSYFTKANLKIVDNFGDYYLNPFNKEESDRLIFIVKKEE